MEENCVSCDIIHYISLTMSFTINHAYEYFNQFRPI